MSSKKFKVGDYITFKAQTRYSNKKATRKVNGIDHLTGWPTVRYAGYGDFVVYPREILAVKKEGSK